MNHDSSGGGLEMIALGWVVFIINMTFNWLESQFNVSLHIGHVLTSILVWFMDAALIDMILNNLHHLFTFLLGGFQLYVTYLGYKKIKTTKKKGDE